jgi:hypothetical protein
MFAVSESWVVPSGFALPLFVIIGFEGSELTFDYSRLSLHALITR